MPSPRAKRLLIVGGLLAAALPALASQPESLLPPGFSDPKTLPPPVEQPKATPTPAPAPDGAAPPSAVPPPPRPQRAQPLPREETSDSALEDLVALPPQPSARFYDLPQEALRPTDVVGVIDVTNRGLPVDAWGDASGPYLGTLMQRLDAPLPSRWASILLRRALLSRVNAPGSLNPVDWVAQRTRLLLRMGEADAARMLVQSVDVDSFTPAMVGAAYETALATSDPAGLCPLVQKGRQLSDDPAWPMAAAMCAALEGEPVRAGTLIDEARRRGARGIDLTLAEKVVGSGGETRRAVTIDWEPVPELNLWRFGLASSTGNLVPERLLDIAGPRMQAWLARAPMVPVGARLAAAEVAAALGVFSSAALVDVHALALDANDAEQPADSAAVRLQTAYAGREQSDRMAALRRLWEDGADPLRRHGRLILTAGAVARLAPSEDLAGDVDQIVASLLSAGMDDEAAEWSGIVEGQGGSTRAWALLAVGSARPAVGIDSGRIEDFGGSGGPHRTQLLAAALAGLERIEPAAARALGVVTDRENGWTRALDQAAASGQSATVALLAAVGLQAPDWNGVPADHLYRIVRALCQVGLEYEARMIAAEAITRA